MVHYIISYRIMSKIFSAISRSMRGPSIPHSIMYGIFAGSAFYSLYIGYRGAKLFLNSTQDLSSQSRWRYLEKQQLYTRELGQDAAASYVSNLVSEYDPTALRLPGEPFDPNLKF